MTRLNAIGACVVCAAMTISSTLAGAGNDPPRHSREIPAGGKAIPARNVLPATLPDGEPPIVRLNLRNHTDLATHGVTVSIVGPGGMVEVIQGVRFPGRRRDSALDRNGNMRLDRGEMGAQAMPANVSTATRFIKPGQSRKPKGWTHVDVHLSRNLRNNEQVVIKLCVRSNVTVGGVRAETWFDLDHGGPRREFRLNAADVGSRTMLPGAQNVMIRFIKQANRVSKNHVEVRATRARGNPAITWMSVSAKRQIAALGVRHGWVSLRSLADDDADRRVDAGETDHDYTPGGAAVANRCGVNLVPAPGGHTKIDASEETLTGIIMDRRPTGNTVRRRRGRWVTRGDTALRVRLGVRADIPAPIHAGDWPVTITNFVDAFERGDTEAADLNGDGRLDLLDLIELIRLADAVLETDD